jgi:TonB family protein
VKGTILRPVSHLQLSLSLLGLIVCAGPVAAQTVTPTPTAAASAPAATPPPQPALSETEAAQRRIARARALAAIGKLAAAAAELESLRSSTADEPARDVARVLLMSIFVEMPDYARATALLDEAFAARAAGGAQQQAYFALAGQTVSAVRIHLERYRAFGLNVADGDLPSEANGDLEQLRLLLERVVEQAKAIGNERAGGGDEAARGRDATALLEDAATVRMRVARANSDDRTRWQTEVSEARTRLFATDTRIASLSDLPSARAAANQLAGRTPATTPAATGPASAQPPANTNAGARSTTTAAAPPANAPTGEAAAPAAPVSIGSLFAKSRSRSTPSYPAAAKSARIAGVVTVFLLVNEKGEVESVERTDGHATLTPAAVEAARRWKFHPTVVNGQPVRVRGYLSFDFKP